MSQIIDQTVSKTQNHKEIGFDRVGAVIHNELKSSTIIFTISESHNDLHYYTLLNPAKCPYIELYWLIELSHNHIVFKVCFTSFRTLGKTLNFDSLRMKVQVSSILRMLNKSMPYYLTFLLDQKSEVVLYCRKQVELGNQSKKGLTEIRQIIRNIQVETFKAFDLLLHLLIIPLGRLMQSQQQSSINRKELDLIRLKNTFDRFKRYKDSTVSNFMESKQINAVKRKVEQNLLLMGKDLKTFDNLRLLNRQIRFYKIFEGLQKSHNKAEIDKKLNRIAYQFEILKSEQQGQKMKVQANSELSLGVYHFRVFKTILQESQFTSQCQTLAKNQENQLIKEAETVEEKKQKLVKKKPNNLISKKSLQNEKFFVKLLRNQFSRYIATFYLPLESQQEELFVQYYETSLHSIITEKELPHENQKSSRILSTLSKFQLCIKIGLGLKLLSDNKVCHRDIKPSNIMVSKSNQPKIIDFGSCVSLESKRTSKMNDQRLCSTKGYYQPWGELPQEIKYLFSRSEYQKHPLFDNYSFGVVIQKLLSQQLQQKNLFGPNGQIIRDTLAYVIEKLKDINPDNRLSFDEILCFLMLMRECMAENSKRVSDSQCHTHSVEKQNATTDKKSGESESARSL